MYELGAVSEEIRFHQRTPTVLWESPSSRRSIVSKQFGLIGNEGIGLEGYTEH